jgi:hypothetical protein
MKPYEAPEMEIIRFESGDVLTSSQTPDEVQTPDI